METSIFEMMEQKRLETKQGSIFYWYSKCGDTNVTMVFLHGLTADLKNKFLIIGDRPVYCAGMHLPTENRGHIKSSHMMMQLKF